MCSIFEKNSKHNKKDETKQNTNEIQFDSRLNLFYIEIHVV